MYASILAGGSGTRLWPLSTKAQPKQFLRLTSDHTMLQETVERIAPLVPLDQLYIVTFDAYRDAVGEQLAGLPRANIIAEPVGRGTAASIGLAAALISARDPQAVMASFHADHAIQDAEGFRQALRLAEEIARRGALVTLGIQPSYPETGYGYIKFGNALYHSEGLEAREVERFIEKPRREMAEEFVRAGHYAWNAGIFVWRVDRILEEINRFVPAVGSVLSEIRAAAIRSEGRMTPEVEEVMRQAWPRLHENVTIDVGVLEKASGLVVIPVEVGWNDIGSWAQVAGLQNPDHRGNAVVGLPPGEHMEVDSEDNLVFSTTGRVVALAGVSGLVVVDTGDALLVCSKQHAQLVKEIAEQMQQKA
ncbi:MAG TPA: sugar phosphate nucleotidyltransferase [Ktedonobacterales bacterium]